VSEGFGVGDRDSIERQAARSLELGHEAIIGVV